MVGPCSVPYSHPGNESDTLEKMIGIGLLRDIQALIELIFLLPQALKPSNKAPVMNPNICAISFWPQALKPSMLL